MTDIVCLSLLLTFFYLIGLGHYPLFIPDEGRYSEVAREMVAMGDYITPRVNGVAFLDKPVLYYWLQAIAIHLFGIKEWALRLFPALFGVLGCVINYVCGRHLFNRRTGLISAIILATSPLYFSGAHYANLDLEVAVFISSTLLCFITGILSQDSSRHYFLITAYIAAALAFLTKGLIGIAFPAMIVGTWIIVLWRWDILKKIHLILGCLLFLVLVLPWYVLVQRTNPEFLHYFFVTQQVSRFLSSGKFNNPTSVWFYVPIILIGFLPWTSFLIQALGSTLKSIWQARREYPVELYLFLWATIVLVFFSIPHSKIITYILPIYPALALLVGNFLSNAWDHARQPAINWGIFNIVAIGILLAIGWLTTSHYHWLNLNIPAAFIPYLKALAIVYIIHAIATLFLSKQKTLLPLFILSTTCSTIFLLIFIMGAAHLNQNTTQPLANDLKKIIRPQDEVVNYFRFYQDLPIYLERRITLVADWTSPNIAKHDNWIRELWYGMPFQNTDAWLINEDEFWKRWNSERRVFVFLNEKDFSQFKLHAARYYFLGMHNDIILLSNKLNVIRM
ncbi:MAG: glycosyltransferase family 39 protein [Gammaproteobacteria bacterium]|nr:glycosyltransferase family 39 protein [Gammaproteobacteria bacterium]